MAQKKLLTPQELADLLSVTVSWVYEHARHHRLPRVPLPGRLLRFDPDIITQLNALDLGSMKTEEKKGKKLGRKLRGEELWS